jgi:hypothetical protein
MEQAPQPQAGNAFRAFAGSGLNAVPLVGPYLLGGAQRLAAVKRSAFDPELAYDEALAGLQASEQATQEAHPWASTAGTILGAVAGAAPAVAAAPEVFGAQVGVPLAARMLAGGATNAAVGGADAAIRGEDVGPAAAIGGAFGAAGPALGDFAGARVRKFMGTRAVDQAPSLDDIRGSAKAAYDAADAAGLVVAPQAVGRIAQTARQVVAKGFHPRMHPDIAVVLDELDDAATAPQSLDRLDTIRQFAVEATQSGKPSERRLGGILLGHIDDALENLSDTDVIAGDVQAGTAALSQARQHWRTLRKSEGMADIFERAKNAAGANYTGGAGEETAIRQGSRRLADSKKLMRGYSPDEQAAIQGVVRGGPVRNTARMLGKLAPRGSVSALPVAAAASMGGLPAGAGLIGVGELGRATAMAMTRNAANKADALIRSGGTMPAAPPSAAADAASRLVQLLSLSGVPALMNRRN